MAVSAKSFSNVTATVAEPVTLQAEINVASLCISVPEKSLLRFMLSLCPRRHAKVHRTLTVIEEMPLLMLELWREQHPHGHE